MNELEIKELPLPAKVGICWGFFWRGICITLASSLCGALIGGVVGFLFALLGIPKSAATAVAGIVGLACGGIFLYFYIRWLLSARLGGFRLALLYAHDRPLAAVDRGQA